MKLSRQDQINYGVLALFVLGAGLFMYFQLRTPDASPQPAATIAPVAPAKPAARPVTQTGVQMKANTGDQLDPTLHMEAMLVTESLVYSGNGRNIFSANSAPTVLIPKVIAKVRTPELVTPVRTGPVGPPPPPPIDLKFFGTETTPSGGRRGFLLHGEDVFLVSAGEIVQRRYRVISIDARSIVIEDIPNSNRQTLPLLAN